MSFFSYNFGKPFSVFALKIHFQQISFARLDEKQIHFPFLNSSFSTKFLRLFIKFRTSNCVQRFAATRSGELRNCVFSAKIKFLAENKREFSTFLAISCNRCWWLHFFSTATFLFQRGYKISICGCYNSICGYNNSFGGYYISFYDYYNFFSG